MPNRDGKGPGGKGPGRKFRDDWEEEDDSRQFRKKNRDRKRNKVYKKYIDNEEE
jgi:hypothetical protein